MFFSPNSHHILQYLQFKTTPTLLVEYLKKNLSKLLGAFDFLSWDLNSMYIYQNPLYRQFII